MIWGYHYFRKHPCIDSWLYSLFFFRDAGDACEKTCTIICIIGGNCCRTQKQVSELKKVPFQKIVWLIALLIFFKDDGWHLFRHSWYSVRSSNKRVLKFSTSRSRTTRPMEDDLGGSWYFSRRVLSDCPMTIWKMIWNYGIWMYGCWNI